MRALVSHLVPCTVSEGEVVLREGHPNEFLYFVGSGALKAMRHSDDGMVYRTFKAGEFFGEFSLLHAGETCTAVRLGIIRSTSRSTDTSFSVTFLPYIWKVFNYKRITKTDQLTHR